MDTAVSAAFATCRDALAEDKPQRVWSLIVTIFGDMAQAPGQRISGAALGQITELIGVKPEAMRVALHRLRKDGWIESQREGRASVHFLTDFGRRLSAEATPRIYGHSLPRNTPAHLLVADDNSAASRRLLEAHVLTDAYVPFGNGLAIGLGEPPEDTGDLFTARLDEVKVPDWVKQRVCSDALLADYLSLHAALTCVDAALAPLHSLSSPEVAALRTLIVHSWRRVLLRHPNLPPRFFPDDFPGTSCRALVADILRRLPLEAHMVLDNQCLSSGP